MKHAAVLACTLSLVASSALFEAHANADTAAAPVAVKADICKPLDGDGEAESARQDKVDRTTLCELQPVAAAPGVPTIKARKPGFCDRLPKDQLANATTRTAFEQMQQLAAGKLYWTNTPDLLGALCVSPDDAQVQKQTGYFYQWWANLTGLPPEQMDGLFRYFASTSGNGQDLYKAAEDDVCKEFPEASTEASPRDQTLAKVMRVIMGCGNDGAPFWVDTETGTIDVSWQLDAAPAEPSELLRSYSVMQCLWDGDIDDKALAAYAVCGTDARALDSAKLEKQIAGYSELAKAHARMTFAAAQRRGARYETAARAKAKADKAWQTILFDAPAQGWKAWDALYAANGKAIDAARAYEELYQGPSRKAAKGCWDGAWKDLTAYVAKASASTLIDAKKAFTDTVGTILLERATMCADAEGKDLLSTDLDRLLEYGRPARGPRYQAFYAVIDAINTISADRDKFAVDPTWFANILSGRSPVAKGDGGDITSFDLADGDTGGVVKSVKKDAGGVIVEFKTDRWKEPAYNCTDTNHITMFKSDGTIVYQQNCVYAGERTVEQTHDPIWVPADLAGGIAPGAFVRSASSATLHQGDHIQATPVEVWKNKERKTLVAYVGVKL